jgi:hypothetical protein
MIESVLEQSNADTFKTVMAEFAPKGARVLDVTAGHLQLWKKLLGQTSMSGQEISLLYDPVFMDIRPLPNIQVVASFAKPLPFRNGTFDAVGFDPPYAGGGSVRITSGRILQSGEQVGVGGQRKGQFESAVTGSISYEQIRQIIPKLQLEFYRVLKPQGIIILKSSDLRENGEVFPFTSYVYGKWHELFALEGYVIQHIPTSGVAQKTHVRNAHNTWSIWRHRYLGK